jgi:cytochrome c5
MNFYLRCLWLALLAGVLVVPGFAADGKTLYRNNCKVCHDKGSASGTYSPMTLTQDQWKKFFTGKLIPAHQSVVHPTSNKKLLESLTPDEMKAIQNFCVDHAADSEQPATCG